MENQMVKTCSYCKNDKTISEYMSDAGRELKMCKICRDIKNKLRKSCPHQKDPFRCHQCGKGYCDECGRKREYCKDGCKGPKEKFHIYELDGYIILQYYECGKQKQIRRRTVKNREKAIKEIEQKQSELMGNE